MKIIPGKLVVDAWLGMGFLQQKHFMIV